MSDIIRRHNDDGDTHLFDGVGRAVQARTVFQVIFEGLSALLALLLLRPLLWWVFRINFLSQSNTVLATYRIDHPLKHRLHALLAGICLIVSVISGSMWYFGLWRGLLVVSGIGFAGYIALTVIFFLNRKEDPVAHCWD